MVNESAVLAYQLGCGLQFLWCCRMWVLLCLVCPPIVELGGLACKERGQLSEDFVSVVGGWAGEGTTEFWVSLGGSGFFSIGDGVFFVRSGFLSNNPPLGFAILPKISSYKCFFARSNSQVLLRNLFFTKNFWWRNGLLVHLWY